MITIPHKIWYDLTGLTFGMLTVVGIAKEKASGNRSLWDCVCECGNRCTADGYTLRHGETVSCGCKRKTHHIIMHNANTTHGMTHTRIYKIWEHIIQRCNKRSKDDATRRYRELGVTVCEEWRNSFVAFYDWSMKNGYNDSLTIDRIDTYGNYEPSNCRWATRKEQMNNTRKNVRYTHNGETHTITEWHDITGIPAGRIAYRIRRGWPDEMIFDQENHQKNRVIRRVKQ